MHILYHHRTMARGGEGAHIRSITKGLQILGHQIQLIGPPGVHSRTHQEEWPVDKTNSAETGLGKLWKLLSRHSPQWLFEILEFAYNFRAFPSILKAIRKADFLYERYAFFLWAGAVAAWLAKTPFILEVNEVAGLKRARGQVFRAVASKIEKQIFRRADAIFVVSSSLKSRLTASGICEDKIIVQPNAIDPGLFRTMPGADMKVRANLGYGDCVVAGFVGWFDEWDNLETLLDQVASIRREAPNFRLLLVGSGRMLPQLEQRIRDLQIEDIATLTGPIEKSRIPAYIAAMDICLIPDSNLFGSPLVLFEYMASKKPVLARKLPPITDVIVDEMNGLLFTHLGDASFKHQLMRLLQNIELREKIGQNAQKCVLENHTWEGNSRRIVSAYQTIKEETGHC